MLTQDWEDFEYAVFERLGPCPEPNLGVAQTPLEIVDAYAAATTPGDQATVSLKARAFYRLRDAFVKELTIPPERIGPQTRLVEIMPLPKRRPDQWRSMARALDFRGAPRLVRSRGLEIAISFLVGGIWLTSLVALIARLSTGQSLALATAIAFLLGIFLLRATRSARIHMPHGVDTVGDLATYLVAEGSPVLEIHRSRLSRSQLIEIVRDLLRTEAGVVTRKLDRSWSELEGSRAAP